MKQTFVPEHAYAKAFGTNMRISTKSAELICNVIRNKPLTRAKRLLEDLVAERRSLRGKYYTKAVEGVLDIVNSCQKNAEFKGLDIDRLFVHASAQMGPNMRRRRRKGAFGNKLKSTHVEVMLIERGKQPKDKVPEKKIKQQIEKKQPEKENVQLKQEMKELRQEQKQLQEDVKEAEKKIEKTDSGNKKENRDSKKATEKS